MLAWFAKACMEFAKSWKSSVNRAQLSRTLPIVLDLGRNDELDLAFLEVFKHLAAGAHHLKSRPSNSLPSSTTWGVTRRDRWYSRPRA